MNNRVTWLFGRGLSIACGLSWDVPAEWWPLERGEKIDRISRALLVEMDAPHVSVVVIRAFLNFLAQRTKSGWRQWFVTTNWDFLLQREILNTLPEEDVPCWLSTSHVSHLNGSIEVLPNNSHPSPFLLPEDPRSQRTETGEANDAYSRIIEDRLFIVVGMSFECETDKSLLTAINRVEDDMPVGESTWLIVNPDQTTLEVTSKRIKMALPFARVWPVCRKLEQWLEEGCPVRWEYLSLE